MIIIIIIFFIKTIKILHNIHKHTTVQLKINNNNSTKYSSTKQYYAKNTFITTNIHSRFICTTSFLLKLLLSLMHFQISISIMFIVHIARDDIIDISIITHVINQVTEHSK